MPRYTIRVMSGEFAGRYLGPDFGGLRSESELIASRDAKVNGTSYYLYADMRQATQYLPASTKAVQTHLKNLGYDSELIEVDALDAIVGLSLSLPNVEERVLRVCQIKFKESDTESVRLIFAEDRNEHDVIIDKNMTAPLLKEVLALVRAKGYLRIAGYKC